MAENRFEYLWDSLTEFFENNSPTVNYILLFIAIIVVIIIIIVFILLIIYNRKMSATDDDMSRYQSLQRRKWWQILLCIGKKQPKPIPTPVPDKLETMDPAKDWRNYHFSESKDLTPESPSAWNESKLSLTSSGSSVRSRSKNSLDSQSKTLNLTRKSNAGNVRKKSNIGNVKRKLNPGRLIKKSYSVLKNTSNPGLKTKSNPSSQ